MYGRSMYGGYGGGMYGGYGGMGGMYGGGMYLARLLEPFFFFQL